MSCPECGSEDIDTENARRSCTECGFILGENEIVFDAVYEKEGQGPVQPWVSNTRQPALSNTAVHGGFGRGGDSRQLTLSKGHRKIQQVATSLNLTQHHVDSAKRLFMLAVQHNFLQGRKTQNVVAACLYLVCRREKTPHLLIDFSDVLQTNLYVLGSTYLKFSRLLNFPLPVIDPSLYIRRFASKLEFGDKTHEVAMTALRLVARMKRDWIQVGRRPSGICGASLLIAARMHGFRRSQREVVRVVRICEATLRKRLSEFIATPAGSLTMEQFQTQDIDASKSQDPPSFLKAQEAQALLTNDTESDDREETKQLENEVLLTLEDKEFQQLTETIDTGLDASSSKSGIAGAAKRKRGADEDGLSVIPAGTVVEESDSLSDLDDTEINSYLLTEQDSHFKQQIWEQINKDWIEAQEEKQKLLAEQVAAGVVVKKRKYNRRKAKDLSADSAAEAAMKMLTEKKLSSKINYEALQGLFDQSSFLLHSAAIALEPEAVAKLGLHPVDELDNVEEDENDYYHSDDDIAFADPDAFD